MLLGLLISATRVVEEVGAAEGAVSDVEAVRWEATSVADASLLMTLAAASLPSTFLTALCPPMPRSCLALTLLATALR
jgi:hypothetical protein